MKLATALSERADLQRRLSELQSRLVNNAKVQEGDEPAESPAVLVEEMDTLLECLERTISRINLTNSAVRFEGKTMTELLARRDCLSKRLKIMRTFLEAASTKVDRYSQKEIKILSTVKVADLQRQVDADSKELRELDEQIQALNWTTELIES
ncbi:MAG: DIP1984 family protein [Oscillospiraceae bacterium]|nr:DIP1984 family protein [Oscillospiraceae bacterium]